MTDLMQAVARHIAQVTGAPFAPDRSAAAGGGCISTAMVLSSGAVRYFVKLNDAARLDMFEAEAEGLEELRAAGGLRVPCPVCTGTQAGRAYLVLEYLPLGRGTSRTQAALGAGLARLHRHTAGRYGWKRDNTIGSTPQRNPWSDDWAGFWRDHRLGFQLGLAARAGHGGRLLSSGERLCAALPAFFADYRPPASLLHGDLWSGNCGADADGAPVIFDPAVYYGDRETDLAMTELFGGFAREFRDAYHAEYPLDAGYTVRRNLYNLYHVLNHLNLFGGGYARQAQSLIDQLLANA